MLEGESLVNDASALVDIAFDDQDLAIVDGERERFALIAETGERMLHIGRKHVGKRSEVTVSVSSHVHKPHTPFQWEGMAPREQLRLKHSYIRRAMPRQQINHRQRRQAKRNWMRCALTTGRGHRTNKMPITANSASLLKQASPRMKPSDWLTPTS